MTSAPAALPSSSPFFFDYHADPAGVDFADPLRSTSQHETRSSCVITDSVSDGHFPTGVTGIADLKAGQYPGGGIQDIRRRNYSSLHIFSHDKSQFSLHNGNVQRIQGLPSCTTVCASR